jgi:hypothetical protein
MTSKTVSLLLISALLAGCGISRDPDQPATAAEWKSYTNNRFGFRLTYPPTLVAGRDPDNGAGNPPMSCILKCNQYNPTPNQAQPKQNVTQTTRRDRAHK